MRFNLPTAKEHKVPNHILIAAQVARLDLLAQSTKTLKCVPNSVKSVSFCVVWGEETNGLHDKWKIYAQKKLTSYPLPDLCNHQEIELELTPLAHKPSQPTMIPSGHQFSHFFICGGLIIDKNQQVENCGSTKRTRRFQVGFFSWRSLPICNRHPRIEVQYLRHTSVSESGSNPTPSPPAGRVRHLVQTLSLEVGAALTVDSNQSCIANDFTSTCLPGRRRRNQAFSTSENFQGLHIQQLTWGRSQQLWPNPGKPNADQMQKAGKICLLPGATKK